MKLSPFDRFNRDTVSTAMILNKALLLFIYGLKFPPNIMVAENTPQDIPSLL